MIDQANLPKIVLLSGPPRSGKDTVGDILRDRYQREKFSGPMKKALPALLDRPFAALEAKKEESLIGLNLPSFRQLQIDLSEKWAKPLYGENIFARLLVDRIGKKVLSGHRFVITDCGFQVEVDFRLEALGPKNCLVINLDAPGCSYAGDSRKPVSSRNGCANYYIWNAKQGFDALRHDIDQVFEEVYSS